MVVRNPELVPATLFRLTKLISGGGGGGRLFGTLPKSMSGYSKKIIQSGKEFPVKCSEIFDPRKYSEQVTRENKFPRIFSKSKSAKI